ncbi:MAG: MmgE/PrpD family protein [Synergistaceae bacterium]|nr:MmgE/PrpD family protein [Synergistaceae bacterium]
MEKNTDASVDFARNVVNTTFGNISAKGVEFAKQDILDTLGTLLGGSTADAGKEVVELAKEWGGKPESTIMAYGGKVPAPLAAFCNATMAHALDLDDTHATLPVHIGPIVVSTAFAIAQRVGNVDGKEFITSVALGADMLSRLARARTYPIHKYGFMFTPLYGYFGAASAAGKLLKLDESQMVNAYGIAYAQCAGNVQVNIDDEHALTKRLSCGFAARGGIMSALLAKKGLTGAQHSLEGRFGLFNIYQRGDYDHDVLVKDIGKVYEIDNLSFKPYACCRQAHSYIDAALQLKRKHSIEPSEIDTIKVFINELAGRALCEPFELRCAPKEEVHAQFSIPWNVGVALAHGKVAIDCIQKENLNDAAVLAITKKITAEIDPALEGQKLLAPEKAVEIRMKDGRVLTSSGTSTPKGDPANPMSYEELTAKFMDCLTFAPKKLDNENVKKAIDMCIHLEEVKNVGDIALFLS